MKKWHAFDRVETLHHRPQRRLRQRIYRRIDLVGRREQLVRVVRRLVEPPLKHESGLGDQIDAVIDGVTALATVQKRIHQRVIGLQIPRDLR